jgi:hypothetical protein
MESNMDVPQKTKLKLPYNLAIPLLAIYPKECSPTYDRATDTTMFTAALIIIVNLWKRTRCPTTDELIKNT